MAEDSVRRSQVIREEAKEALRAFLQGCSLLIPNEHRTHFRRELGQRRYHLGIGFSIVGPYDDSTHKPYTDAFMRILQATAQAHVPNQKDLNVLCDALNEPFAALLYRPNQKPPYSTYNKLLPLRSTADNLLAYLNLTHRAGPAHAVCRVCGCLMIQQRGGRKYCSEVCSKKAWSYEARKEKHAEYRKLQRRRTQQRLGGALKGRK